MEAYKYGIGITAYKRPEIDNLGIENILRFIPEGCKVYIARDVDGIAKAKNKCLKALEMCKHIWLFDSDTWPKVKNWHIPYVNSGINHLCMTWGRKEIKRERNLIYYELPNGCMIYLRNDCLKKIGGFDEEYIKWGFEHVDFSQRIYNVGLTEHPFIDLCNSSDLIYSMDKEQIIKSSVLDKHKYIEHNRHLFMKNRFSKEFKPYK